MANLRWFRKHQKIMLVVFGVVLMAVFVLGSVVPFFGNPGDNASPEEIAKFNQTVVQWSGGKLSRGQLQRLIELHYATMNFQDSLLRDSVSRSPQGPLVRQITAIPANSVESADRAIFARFMMAEYAKKFLGMVISDAAVYDYMQALANADVSQQYLAAICRKANPSVGYGQLHEYLKMELTAMRLEDIIGESFFISGSGAAPANILDAWQAFLQNEKQIECAVEEFNIEDFLPQINGEPDASQLRTIYDQGKTRNFDPSSKLSGFKRPRQVQVEYLAAEASAFLERAIQDVTPEQVVAEYNRLVEAKDPFVMEPIPPSALEPAENLDGEKLEDDVGPELKNIMDDPSDPAPAPGSGDPAPATEKPNDGGPPSADAETEKSPPNQSPDDKSGGQLLRLAADTQFVSFRSRVHHPRQEASPQDDEKGQPEPNLAEPGNPEMTQSAEPQNESAPLAPANDSELKQDSATPADPVTTPAQEVAPQKPVQQAKKLDAALELAIKQRLKRDEANTQQAATVEKAREFMDDYTMALSDYESTKDLPRSEQSPLPSRADLKAYAAEHHLKYGMTALCTYEELIKDPVGLATEFQQDPTTGRFGTRRAADELFVNFDRKRLFSVDEIDSIGDTYLYWLTEKVDSRIPSFEEARNDAIEFWKRNEAIALAQAAAKKIQDEFNASGKMLTDEHKTKTKLTGGFRWFQPAFNQVNYGTPQGVKSVGEEFMSAAFQLAPNKVGIAVNDDRSAVYAIQLIAADPRSDEQLRDQFLDHVATVRQIVPSATNTFYNRRLVQKMVDALNDDLQVEWIAY